MIDLDALAAKWETFGKLMLEPERDGSLVGRLFIIASSAKTDIAALIAELREERESDD